MTFVAFPRVVPLLGLGLVLTSMGCRAPCDADRDGHESESCGGLDCNDADATIHPGALQICGDGIDQGCEGRPCGIWEGMTAEDRTWCTRDTVDDLRGLGSPLGTFSSFATPWDDEETGFASFLGFPQDWMTWSCDDYGTERPANGIALSSPGFLGAPPGAASLLMDYFPPPLGHSEPLVYGLPITFDDWPLDLWGASPVLPGWERPLGRMAGQPTHLGPMDGAKLLVWWVSNTLNTVWPELLLLGPPTMPPEDAEAWPLWSQKLDSPGNVSFCCSRGPLFGFSTLSNFAWAGSTLRDADDGVAVGVPMFDAPGLEGTGWGTGAVALFSVAEALVDPVSTLSAPAVILSHPELGYNDTDCRWGGDLFGRSVAGGADLDGDGSHDLIVGAPLSNTPGLNGIGAQEGGAAYIFWGPVDRRVGRIEEFEHTRIDSEFGMMEWFGRSVEIVGDINADGFPDLAIAAPGVGIGDIDCDPDDHLPGENVAQEPNVGGAVYLYFGPLPRTGPIQHDLRIDFPVTWEDPARPYRLEGGPSPLIVRSLGDVDGDSFDDLVVDHDWNTYWFRGGPGL